MASFYQPGLSSPVEGECTIGHSSIRVLCNRLVVHKLDAWYKIVNLTIGLNSIFIPILLFGLYRAIQALQRRYVNARAPKPPQRRPRYRGDGSSRGSTRMGRSLSHSGRPSDSASTEISEFGRPVMSASTMSLRNTRSFRLISEAYADSEIIQAGSADFTFPMAMANEDDFGRSRGSVASNLSALSSGAAIDQMRLGRVELDTIDHNYETLSLTIAGLVEQSNTQDLTAFALRVSNSTSLELVDDVMVALYDQNISSIILVHHDCTVLNDIDMTYAAGIIIENACILPNGERRGYFHAGPLREAMRRCTTERVNSPDFFVGFLDQWLTRPHPSVIKRAVKVAEHFGAVLEHGPAYSTEDSPNPAKTISGFEYLRRAEVIDLQRSWMSSSRNTFIEDRHPQDFDLVAQLSVDDIDLVVPGTSECLETHDLPPELRYVQADFPEAISPPSYIEVYPASTVDLWEADFQGQPLCPRGCFPVGCEPTSPHFYSVVETQAHLCELHMLQDVKGQELQAILQQLKTFAEWPRPASDNGTHVASLIEGIKSAEVRIYKGLHSGFRMPDGDAQFWGVCKIRNLDRPSGVDIYISQQSPNDTGVILHTWLAHNQVPRVQRFQEEILLEEANGGAHVSRLPRNIRSALQACSASELISLLQKYSILRGKDPLGDDLYSFVHSLLLDETSKTSWTGFIARSALASSTTTMREILNLRLTQYAKQGAVRLPLLEELMILYSRTEEVMLDALYRGRYNILRTLTTSLVDCYGLEPAPDGSGKHVDLAADFFSIIFFTILRRAAFEDVYLESTDRCPLFLSQPDQAAVFSELWTLGSQCENYFGVVPRDIGNAIYYRYNNSLESQGSPSRADRKDNEIMTMYCSTDAPPTPNKDATLKMLASSSTVPKTPRQWLEVWSVRISTVSSMAIFCLPVIVDVTLLAFLGRGLFISAFMDPRHLQAAGYAILVSLLLSAGVMGWIGSGASHYIPHYAYSNMIHFHVARLAGASVLAVLVSIGGIIFCSVKSSVAVGFIFAAYLMAVSTYLNLLGVMSTMNQHHSPLSSGRNVFLGCCSLLLLSPLLSTVINGHDLEIYLPVIYGFLALTLYQYRRLCHQWLTWMSLIPSFTANDILKWHQEQKQNFAGARSSLETSEGEMDTPIEDYDPAQASRVAFRAALLDYSRRSYSTNVSWLLRKRRTVDEDDLVIKVAKGMPYITWLFNKPGSGGDSPEMFTTAWFTKLGEACQGQRSLLRGLKDHHVMTLFRLARYDILLSLGLFGVALLDRWVSIIASSFSKYKTVLEVDSNARYAFCFAIIHFCLSSMVLDATLYKYWSVRDTLSEDPIRDITQARKIAAEAERQRRNSLATAFVDVFAKVTVVFGVMTIFMWLFLEQGPGIISFYGYVFGYTCCSIFQFNRCFTTNVAVHTRIILGSAIIGFILGIVFHSIPYTSQFLYIDMLSQNFAAACAAIGTSLWSFKDWWGTPSPLVDPDTSRTKPTNVHVQCKFMANDEEKTLTKANVPKAFTTPNVYYQDGSTTSALITELLTRGWATEAKEERPEWYLDVLDTTTKMWCSNNLKVTVLGRVHFSEAGLEDLASLSISDSGSLHVAICFTGQQSSPFDTRKQQLLPELIAESLLYHVAIVRFQYSVDKAVHAEQLLDNTRLMTQRLEAEVSQTDSHMLELLARRSLSNLLKHLCLHLDVDTEWESLPVPVRQVILARISGELCQFTPEFNVWAYDHNIDIETFDFQVRLTAHLYQLAIEQRNRRHVWSPVSLTSSYTPPAALKPVSIPRGSQSRGFFWNMWALMTEVPLVCIKWIAIISSGGSKIERELYYLLAGVPLRGVLLYMILMVWVFCTLVREFWTYTILLYHSPSLLHITRLARKGSRRKIYHDRVIVELTRSAITGFVVIEHNGNMSLHAFKGTPTEMPTKGHAFVATYDKDCRLISKIDSSGATTNYTYDTATGSRIPMAKECNTSGFHSKGYYDKTGRIIQGFLSLDGTDVGFQYRYSKSKGNHQVLRADFKSIGSDDALSVLWGKPDNIEDYNWVPSKNIGLIIRRIGGKIYTTEYEYTHRRDPTITSFLELGNGHRTVLKDAPSVFPSEKLLLEAPADNWFDMDDLLIHHSTLQIRHMHRYANSKVPGFFSKLNPITWGILWNSRKYTPVPTSRIRTELWSKWLKTNDLDAVTACCVDELVLREEPLLRPYWRMRDAGRLEAARAVLDENLTQIAAAIDIETDVSEVTLLAIRTADLYEMGLGKDANPVTARPQDCYNDTPDRISVIFNDIGCWPIAPGGVSNCRRDLVNSHSTIRNHVLAECANDYGNPRFQIEKSVQSLKLLPLWGLDGGTANHGLITNLLESEVDCKVADTDVQRDIVDIFIPLLYEFVKGCRMKSYKYDDIIHMSNIFLSMAKYYQSKDYTRTWRSTEVEQAWVAAWLRSYNDPNIMEYADSFEIARPTMFDFRQALGIYLAYFFIFAVGVPEHCPRVFQSTHHGISSLFGMVLKYRKGVTFGIWDHAILWRESCLNFSVAQCELSVAVQNMLLSGIGVAMRLAYFHADVVLPCASLFNPMWEAELGSDGSKVISRNLFRRKIDPIVNGISDMEAFKVADKVRTETPTVVMLSNVQFIKGVKFAIQAADLIVNRFGFKDYKLVVYGAKDRQPSYCLEMEKIISDRNLGDHVLLAGFGNPKEVLKDAWLFMNSSISEGLPLAIGEAALAGVPIVATEVGATALVLTDPEDPTQRFGEVVPPNDPMALARAQLSMLSMVGPWHKFCHDAGEAPSLASPAPVLPEEISAEDVEWLTARFYKYSDDRRKLGVLSRGVVLHSFHGNRYIREHEQMYWIQHHLAQQRADPLLQPLPFKFGQREVLRYEDPDEIDR